MRRCSGVGHISEVRFIRNTIDANPKMIGNESSDIVGGEDICDSHGLFSRCHVTDGEIAPELTGHAR
jgi:hypothetical protein